MKKLIFFLIFIIRAVPGEASILSDYQNLQGALEGGTKIAAIHSPVLAKPSVKTAAPETDLAKPAAVPEVLQQKYDEEHWKAVKKRKHTLRVVGSGLGILGTIIVALSLAIGFFSGANIVPWLIGGFIIGVAGFYIMP